MTIPPFSRLDTPRLVVRRFRESDMNYFMHYRNDPEVARYQGWEAGVYTPKTARSFIRSLERVHPGMPGRWFQFAIELRDERRLIGDVALYSTADGSRGGEVGFTVAREYQRRGFAREAVTAVLDYAFFTLNMHRVVARLDVRNRASAGLCQALGMRREAHFLKNAWHKGGWTDEYLYAILDEEWAAQRDEE